MSVKDKGGLNGLSCLNGKDKGGLSGLNVKNKNL